MGPSQLLFSNLSLNSFWNKSICQLFNYREVCNIISPVDNLMQLSATPLNTMVFGVNCSTCLFTNDIESRASWIEADEFARIRALRMCHCVHQMSFHQGWSLMIGGECNGANEHFLAKIHYRGTKLNDMHTVACGKLDPSTHFWLQLISKLIISSLLLALMCVIIKMICPSYYKWLAICNSMHPWRSTEPCLVRLIPALYLVQVHVFC